MGQEQIQLVEPCEELREAYIEYVQEKDIYELFFDGDKTIYQV